MGRAALALVAVLACAWGCGGTVESAPPGGAGSGGGGTTGGSGGASGGTAAGGSANGACGSGAPADTQLTKIGTTTGPAESIVADADSVYVAVSHDSFTDARIIKCSMSGCGSKPTVLATAPDIFDVNVGGKYVYFTSTDNKTSSIERINKDGSGHAVVLSSATEAYWQIRVHGPWLYWTTNSNVERCNASDCAHTVETMMTGDYPKHLAFHAGWLYSSFPLDQQGLMRCEESNCQPTVESLIQNTGTPTIGLAVDSLGRVYFGTDTLYRCPATGCKGIALPPIFTQSPGGAVEIMAMDNDVLYWHAGTGAPGIYKADTSLSTPTPKLIAANTNIADFTVCGSHVFFTHQHYDTQEIYRVGK